MIHSGRVPLACRAPGSACLRWTLAPSPVRVMKLPWLRRSTAELSLQFNQAVLGTSKRRALRFKKPSRTKRVDEVRTETRTQGETLEPRAVMRHSPASHPYTLRLSRWIRTGTLVTSLSVLNGPGQPCLRQLHSEASGYTHSISNTAIKP